MELVRKPGRDNLPLSLRRLAGELLRWSRNQYRNQKPLSLNIIEKELLKPQVPEVVLSLPNSPHLKAIIGDIMLKVTNNLGSDTRLPCKTVPSIQV